MTELEFKQIKLWNYLVSMQKKRERTEKNEEI